MARRYGATQHRQSYRGRYGATQDRQGYRGRTLARPEHYDVGDTGPPSIGRATAAEHSPGPSITMSGPGFPYDEWPRIPVRKREIWCHPAWEIWRMGDTGPPSIGRATAAAHSPGPSISMSGGRYGDTGD